MALTKLQLSQLLDTYGQLLTQKQRDIATMYCDCDCTLTEIATEHGISRQGVRDTVLKTESILEHFEQVLGLSQFVTQVSVATQRQDDDAVVCLTKKFVGKE